MSWMQNLCDTYDACADAVGICGENQTTMLLPLGHLLTELDVIVHLKKDGTFQRAENIKSSAKNKTLICVPCTDESEARSGTKAIDFPHPLFDQIKYLFTQKYVDNLEKWMVYLKNNSKYSYAYQAIAAVYHYVVKGTISDDLLSFQMTVKDDMFVGFCVNFDNSFEDRLWMMPELWKAWIDFYLSEDIAKRQSKDVCYITGDKSAFTEKHPKSINRSSGNAKLITGNDGTNFTFRGRFKQPSQAVTVSFEASQKAHQALRWLISKPSCYRCDSQAIVAWAIDSIPDVPGFYDDSYDVYNAVAQTDEERLTLAENAIYVDYANALKKALSGYSTSSKLKTHIRRISIMSTDAATTGRLSVTYYRELSENEYEERIENWHNTCKWYQPFGKDADGTYKTGYFIGAPAVDRIALAVLGKRRKQKDESYDKLVKNLREQLVHCIFDGERIPASMVNAALNRASNPLAFENTGAKSNSDRWRDWEYVLGAACALIKRYYYDYKKEEIAVELETERRDRDYLYGRLLAVADKIESSARYKQGKAKEDERATNAVRYMTVFSQHPFRTWNMLFTQQLNPYIQQLNGAGWYLNLIGDIKQLFEPGAFERDASLDGKYLLGFFAQRQELRKNQKNNNNNGGEDNELNKEN
ncbi:CRISPR-associated Csd1 family protein [Hydrogenispora ethanolica]|jgi:CRISPR-associated protein Csd1|uniref:CRISPR-associated Csd1 family protein n=1 Tax=Hydrogenispora ethanolica TaxID=1082276 RepID=A0A4R1RII5_HYDET|nr:type I-C CRISPR-associated protein Cas8c/Csd1 [Hydrogenispora ethanolica]TCL65913.1 CRISPR-associated Csd1 family protein [Hydrogenispora ethanolica]